MMFLERKLKFAFLEAEASLINGEKLTFLLKLELKGIERKIDLITIFPRTKFKDIHVEALRTGVKI